MLLRIQISTDRPIYPVSQDYVDTSSCLYSSAEPSYIRYLPMFPFHKIGVPMNPNLTLSHQIVID